MGQGSDTIFIAAAPATTWPLDLTGFGERLRDRWPEVRLTARPALAPNHGRLAFELDIDGERRHGTYFDRRYLVLEDGTPRFWAETIAWFLALLPADAQVVCLTEAVPEPVPLRRDADADQVVAVLESLAG
jgi:hypothetical protein